MENSAVDAGRPFAATTLMLGNFVTGLSVLAPAGMLAELSVDLGVSIREAGLMITFGAVVLCIGSPLTAWLTSRIERRALLAGTIAVLAATNLASAFAPGYASLLAIRLMMLAVGSLYTPQAAGAAALVVPPEKRGGTMSYVFVGWSLAIAVGLPLVSLLSSRYGWRATYAGIAAAGGVAFILLAWRLPRGLLGAPVDLKTWAGVGRNRLILALLLVTTLHTCGQFAVFTFLSPLLRGLTGAGADEVGLVFAIYGVCGLIGNMAASRIVDSFGAYRTALLFVSILLAGVLVWTFGAGNLTIMAVGVALWGLGFASTNSMQQVRLVGADPSLSGATVALNTSTLYIGQAIGSATGGFLFEAGLLRDVGYVATGFVALSLLTVLMTGRLAPRAA